MTRCVACAEAVHIDGFVDRPLYIAIIPLTWAQLNDRAKASALLLLFASRLAEDLATSPVLIEDECQSCADASCAKNLFCTCISHQVLRHCSFDGKDAATGSVSKADDFTR